MKISPHKRYAVLTGDVVDSSKLPKAKRQALPEVLRRASRATRKAFPEAVLLDVDVFRGDGWQLLVGDATLAVRIAFFFRACVRSESERGRGLDTRVAIGIGGIDFVPGERGSEGDGEAYRLSGRALESLPRNQQACLALPPGSADRAAPTVIRLLDALAADWTGRQARAVMGALQGLTQEKIAELWSEPIRQPVVARHLETAHWPAFDEGLRFLEDALRSGPVIPAEGDKARI